MTEPQSRTRPAYEPKTLQCPTCAAPLVVRDERSRFTVCEACNTELGLSAAAAVALGTRDANAPTFALELGDDFRWEGHRYQVCARLVYDEEDDAYATHDYLLYSPRMGSVWLSVYRGAWSISHKTRVMPAGNAFVASRGTKMRTHDGRSWKAVESGVLRVAYVDGALPWVAQLGDVTHYADLAGSKHEEFQVTRIHEELECFDGHKLGVDQVREASGKPDLAGNKLPKLETKGRSWLKVAAIMLLCMITGTWSFGLMFWAAVSGEDVLEQEFPAEAMIDEEGQATEVFSEPFTVSAAGNLVDVDVSSWSLSNEWMALDMALVRDGETVVHVFDQELSSYHGIDYEGYSWSEDNQTASTTFSVPEAGTYQLLVRAVSGEGETPNARYSKHGVAVQIRDGVRHVGWPFLGLVFSGLIFLLALVMGLLRLGES